MNSSRSNLFVLSGLLFVLGFASAVHARVWKDASDKFSIEATLVAASKDKVMLKTKNGDERVISIARLCSADQAYIDEWKSGHVEESRKKLMISPSVSDGWWHDRIGRFSWSDEAVYKLPQDPRTSRYGTNFLVIREGKRLHVPLERLKSIMDTSGHIGLRSSRKAYKKPRGWNSDGVKGSERRSDGIFSFFEDSGYSVLRRDGKLKGFSYSSNPLILNKDGSVQAGDIEFRVDQYSCLIFATNPPRTIYYESEANRFFIADTIRSSRARHYAKAGGPICQLTNVAGEKASFVTRVNIVDSNGREERIKIPSVLFDIHADGTVVAGLHCPPDHWGSYQFEFSSVGGWTPDASYKSFAKWAKRADVFDGLVYFAPGYITTIEFDDAKFRFDPRRSVYVHSDGAVLTRRELPEFSKDKEYTTYLASRWSPDQRFADQRFTHELPKEAVAGAGVSWGWIEEAEQLRLARIMRGREYRVLVGAAKMADFERDFQEAAIALGAATLVAGTAAKIVEGGVTRRSSASPSVRLVVLDDNARSHAEKQEIVLEISELDGSPWTLPMHSGRAQKTLEVDLPKNITIKHRGKVERHSEWEYDGQVFRINTK